VPDAPEVSSRDGRRSLSMKEPASQGFENP
jgi:hypothetical protein